MSTADQIRAQAVAALGAGSTANIVSAAPTATNTPPQAGTTDIVNPAPKVELTIEEKFELLTQQNLALQAQLAQSLGVIASIQPAAVAAVQGERTYHSVSPFIKIQVMVAPGICEAHQFKGNRLTTESPRAIAFLEAAIEAGSTEFSRAPIDPNRVLPEEFEMRKELSERAVTARDKMVAAGEKVA